MRTMALGILAALLSAAAGEAICLAFHLRSQTPAVLWALGAAVVASVLAATPIYVVRVKSTMTVAQAGLLGTLVHLLVFVVAAAIFLFAGLAAGSSFVFWIFGMYLATLVALVAGMARAIHQATPTGKNA